MITRRRFLAIGAGASSGAWLSLRRGAEGGERVSLGLVGLGQRGCSYLSEFHGITSVRVAALCDADPAAVTRAASLASDHRPALCVDYRRLLERPDVDGVVVSVPLQWRTRMILDALSAGKHVLADVPIAAEVGDSMAVFRAAEGSRRLLLPAPVELGWDAAAIEEYIRVERRANWKSVRICTFNPTSELATWSQQLRAVWDEADLGRHLLAGRQLERAVVLSGSRMELTRFEGPAAGLEIQHSTTRQGWCRMQVLLQGDGRSLEFEIRGMPESEELSESAECRFVALIRGGRSNSDNEMPARYFSTLALAVAAARSRRLGAAVPIEHLG